MASNIWLGCVNKNILESAKFNKLRRLPGGDAYVIVFIKMLLHAKRDGFVCDGENYRCFADEIGEKYEMLIISIAILREICLIRLNDDEDVYIHQDVLTGSVA